MEALTVELNINQTSIVLERGDITHQTTGAIVNAANGTLLGGGGVDGAIHSAAGKKLLDACKRVREEELDGHKLPTGEAVITEGYQLPADYVIHTVGPVWGGDQEKKEKLLKNCYENSLDLVVKHELKSIAFPAISTGVYHFPKKLATSIAVESVVQFARNHTLDKIVFVLFSEEDYHIYQNELEKFD